MTLVTFSLIQSLYMRHKLPDYIRGFSDTKKQYQQVIPKALYHQQYRAYDSPEPEGPKMVTNHSVFMLTKNF